jgi:hypothetical protein
MLWQAEAQPQSAPPLAPLPSRPAAVRRASPASHGRRAQYLSMVHVSSSHPFAALVRTFIDELLGTAADLLLQAEDCTAGQRTHVSMCDSCVALRCESHARVQ